MIKQLTEQQYRAYDGISASDLVAILACPAKWRYGEKKTTPAMEKGTQAHACLLEPARFAEAYYRVPEATDYEPLALVTMTEIKAELAAIGVKVPSGSLKPDLVQLATEHNLVTLDCEQALAEIEHAGKQAINAKDWQQITAMSATIYAQEDYAKALTGADVEVSIVDVEHMGIKLKARLDIVTKEGELWDYKTTSDASPSAFGKAAHNYSYWLKMAFYHDMFTAAYGHQPARTILLAQEKESPYLCQAYKLTREQLQAGREAYTQALGIYQRCMDSGVWPAYGGGIMELDTPAWVKINE